MAKKIAFEMSKGEAKLIYESLDEKSHIFDKLISQCLREGLPEAARPITDELKKLHELRERLQEFKSESKDEK